MFEMYLPVRYNKNRVINAVSCSGRIGGIRMKTTELNWKDDAKRILLVVAGAVLYACNMKSFVRAGDLLPGGISGISVLIQQVFSVFFGIDLPFSAANLLLNAIPILIGFKFIGKKFTTYSCVMIVLSSLLTDVIPVQPITYDSLLVGVFGGLLNGVAISLCLMGRASSGGLDFIAIYLSQKLNTDAWNYTLAINAIVLATAGALFGWDKALYSIIFQFTSTQVVKMLYQKHRQHTLFVVTNDPKSVYTTISSCTNHGATVFEGKGSYQNEERSMVYSVVSSDEVKLVMRRIKEADPQAFVNVIRTDHMNGRFFQRKED